VRGTLRTICLYDEVEMAIIHRRGANGAGGELGGNPGEFSVAAENIQCSTAFESDEFFECPDLKVVE